MNLSDLDLDSALAQFGLTSFRPGQREVISAIVSGHDCMCVMPTGGGKSLCYQLPAVIRPGLTIVVSPLIALMKDQVDALGQKGIPAALINSTLSMSEQNERLQDVAAGKFKLVYVAPERLRSNRFLEAIRATPIQLLAVDEAHCISQWGHDFRPDYARLGRFREWLGDVQTVALTATATPRVREDIVQVLRLTKPKQFMSGFARPNLDLGVKSVKSDREKDEQIERFLKQETGSGIIYAATRKGCDALVEMIQSKLKIPVGAYHAGMMQDQRRAIQERFMRNELRIIVATNAFGMGIDKPDLRFVVHYNIPGSLEAYYQEAGRAGRDGKQSQCVLLYAMRDRYIQEFFIDNNYPERSVIEAVYDFLRDRPEDPIELTHEQVRDALGLSISSEAIGSSLSIIARTGVIERLETGGGLAKVRIDSDLPTLVDLLPKSADVKRKILRVVERIVGPRRGEDVFVHPRWLLQEMEIDREAMNKHLREITDRLATQFDYVPPFRGRATHFIRRDVPFADLGIDFEALAKRKEAEYERLNQVIRYAVTPRCRQAAILDYFGDTNVDDCQHCDRCWNSHGWPGLAQQRSHGSPASIPAQLTPVTEVGWIPKTDQELGAAQVKVAKRDAESGPGKAARRSDLASSPATTATSTSTRSSDVLNSVSATAGGDEAEALIEVPETMRSLLVEVLAAIDRTHGRLGKILICQFLCGSNNSKVQKLRLHRLSGFGMLSGLRQSDATELVDAYLSAGLLQQDEVNLHRPTVRLSPDIQNGKVSRMAIIQRLRLSPLLIKRLLELNAKTPVAAETKQAETKATESKAVASSPGVSAVPAIPVGKLAGSAPAISTVATPSTVQSVVPSVKQPLFAEMSAPNGAAAAQDDWYWTWQLLVDGYAWSEVMAIRRKADLEVAADLQQALRQNKTVQRTWLSATSAAGGAVLGDSLDSYPTVGQQRLLRELQRRSAAGV